MVERRVLVVFVGATVIALAAALPALATTPETGTDPTVALTVIPSDGLSDGQTVTVTGTGFPPNAAGTLRECGGSVTAPECDLTVNVAFVTTGTGGVAPTSVTVKRIIDTGTTTFNCGVQACALVASAGGRASQHHIKMAGAGTSIPMLTTTTLATTTTFPSTSTTRRGPSTTRSSGNALRCQFLRRQLDKTSDPFMRRALEMRLLAYGCS